MPLRFTDATGALFYTEDGTATGGGDIMYMYYNIIYDYYIIMIKLVDRPKGGF